MQYGWGDYWTKLTAAMVADDAPDVFVNHLTRYPELAENGQIIALDEQIEASGYDLGQFREGLADLWIDSQGDRYGIPKDFDTTALFYNADLIEQAGYSSDDIASLEWNLDDGGSFEETVAHLTIDENGVRGDEAGFDANNVSVYGFSWANGTADNGQTSWAAFAGTIDGWSHLGENPWGDQWNYDNPRFQKMFGWYYGLAEKGFAPDLGEFSETPIEQMGAGRVAMNIYGSWNVDSYLALENLNLGMAPNPIGDSGKRATVFNGLADSIASTTENPDAAWAFVGYLGSTACQDVIAEAAVVFPAISSSSEKAAGAFADKGVDASVFLDYFDDGSNTMSLPITWNTTEVKGLMQVITDEVWLGRADASKLTEVNESINALYE